MGPIIVLILIVLARFAFFGLIIFAIIKAIEFFSKG